MKPSPRRPNQAASAAAYRSQAAPHLIDNGISLSRTISHNNSILPTTPQQTSASIPHSSSTTSSTTYKGHRTSDLADYRHNRAVLNLSRMP
ncbi:unnamed protein product [Clonostachys solani]|uniref:Uncharacterized protein n=1 Tax=Clonostachys solani TaxID=160281 RepID=A0A9P0ERV2_9HYPO|nr:unnamed protein product [Clonostachys solani]